MPLENAQGRHEREEKSSLQYRENAEAVKDSKELGYQPISSSLPHIAGHPYDLVPAMPTIRILETFYHHIVSEHGPLFLTVFKEGDKCINISLQNHIRSIYKSSVFIFFISTTPMDNNNSPEIFHAQARQALTTLWRDVSPDSIQLSHVCGGANNRIIGVTRPSTRGDAQKPDRFVVRVPNIDVGFRETVAAFLFADRYTKLTTPSTIHFDLGDRNPFGQPYLVQNRLPGTPAADVPFWRDHRRKLRFWSDYGAVFRELLQVHSKIIGVCDFSIVGTGVPRVDSRVGVREYGTRTVSRHVPLPSVMPSSTTAIRDYLLRNYRTSKTTLATLANRLCRPCQPIRLAHVEAFTTLIHEAHNDGLFDGMPVTMRHVDLWPSNVLVAEDGSITGVLDWDEARLEPAFTACDPPELYWTRGMNFCDQNSQAQCEDLKRAFFDSAGAEFCRFAHDEAYELLRRIAGFTPVYWCRCDESRWHYDMDEIIRDWNDIRLKRVGRPSEVKVVVTQ
ncbi:hypothetical protein SODALDRAFT_354714 [Sodiomyces alkalinus F11]|uniref:Aminoglycoside phosphotransferase domain-containing protein n=1 Tax=Sodiomyces alkalinus (strain CBS 110278 / VKM F-3762 / F11) TaxID=1314773 RepID=A0A3N2Q794_SODAK|nr:hypothetical protein SODALDRAFT_354714 [Sodiomyces alkalinus F11]ROT42557.1 hypothetical protein SODALDRAFT_354714 [Sodiomyces alkalinus F11]